MNDMRATYLAEVLRVWGPDADGAHDVGHLNRVWKNCRLIAADLFCDMDVLLAAAMFHDVINLPKNAADRHLASRKSADHAAHFLEEDGFDVGKIPQVRHAIEAHSFSAGITPQTVEARILQDADRIDALGAVGVARMMFVAGSLGRQLFDPDDPWAKNRPLDDKRFAIDHFEVKLFRLAETMTTDAGRKLAESRERTMREFCARLSEELT